MLISYHNYCGVLLGKEVSQRIQKRCFIMVEKE